MITNIQIWKVSIISLFLGQKEYRRIDITDQLEAPIYDTTQLDGVLDTTRISLVNTTKTPLKRFTRIIIYVTDLTDGKKTVEKIYRYVNNDKVENVSRGNNSIFRHNVELIEITKILERRDVPNLTFTNYLSYSVGKGLPMTPERDVRVKIFSTVTNEEINDDFSYNWIYQGVKWGYTNDSDKFCGPYFVLSSDTSKNKVSTNVKMNVKAVVRRSIIALWTKKEKNLALTSYYVNTPTDTIDLSSCVEFEFTSEGTYKFVQIYESSFLVGTLKEMQCKATFTWEIKVLGESNSMVRPYNLRDVVNRILSVQKTRISGVDEPEFELDGNIEKFLSKKISPEFSITEGTLFEALLQVGNYFHAIPRLKPKIIKGFGENDTVIEENDWAYWNVISFDLLDVNYFYKGNNYSLIDLENPSEEYASDFVSNIQNATMTNYDGNSTVIEPCADGFLSTRTESGDFEVSDDECLFKTKYPIRAIVKAELGFNGQSADITKYIVEKAVYDTKFCYSDEQLSEMKQMFLYFEEGKNGIRGLNYVTPAKFDLSNVITGKYALSTISRDVQLEDVTSILPNKLKDYSIRIEYVPFLNFKARQYKSLIDYNSEKSTLFFNQQANEVDIEHYGENMFYTLLKTGNVKVGRTQYFNGLAEAPKCGDYHKSGYFAFQINRELNYLCPIKATSYWSKNYNELYADISIKKAIRQFEISEKECTSRCLDIQEFCIVDTKLDIEKAFSENLPVGQSLIENDLKNVGFGTKQTMFSIASKLANTPVNTEGQITCAICQTQGINIKGKCETHNFILPVVCFPLGRSIVALFKTDNNYSAGTYTKKGSEYGKNLENNNFNIEEYIEYKNYFGRFEKLRFYLLGKLNYTGDKKKLSESLYLFNPSNCNDASKSYCDFYSSKNKVDSNGNVVAFEGLEVDADSRESLAVTCQLNFVTPNKNIIIGSGLSHTTNLTGNIKIKYKYVLFEETQSKLSDTVFGGVKELSMPKIQVSEKTRHIKINGGIIPRSNTGAEAFSQSIEKNSNSILSDLTYYKGFGIITEDNRIVICVQAKIARDSTTDRVLPPIYLMFRRDF